MTISHGFLEGFLDPDQIKPIAKKINNFLDNQSEVSNYYSKVRHQNIHSSVKFARVTSFAKEN